MEYTVKTKLSEALMTEVVHAFFRRNFLRRKLGMVLFLLGFALLAASAVGSWLNGNLSFWQIMVTALAPVFTVAFYSAIIRNYRNQTLARLRQMRTPEVVFTFGENDVKMSSDLGSSSVPWRTFTGILQTPKFWLLFVAKAQFITLPLENVDGTVLEFIDSRLREQNIDGLPA